MIRDRELDFSIDRFLAEEDRRERENPSIITTGIPVGELNFDELNNILEVMKGLPIKERMEQYDY